MSISDTYFAYFPLDSPDGFQKSLNKYTSNQIAKAEEFERKAEKKINGRSIFGCICGSDYKSAARLYGKAADCYKSSKSWDKAAKVYLKIVGCHLQSEDSRCKYEAARAYMHAGDIYKNISATDAIPCFSQAVNLFLEIGSFPMAGFSCEDLAASVAEEDVQKFTDVVKKFGSLTKQDTWKTTLLMRMEEKLKAKEMEKMVKVD